MVWTAPTSKWKTNTWYPTACGNGQCVVFQRFDTLATPRVIEIVGFREVCGDHQDAGNPVPVNRIKNFLGEWMTGDEHQAWESCFYSWVVWHEIGERGLPAAQTKEMQAKQKARSRAKARKIANLDRAETDDGPWKPAQAIVTLAQAEQDAVPTLSGWVNRDARLQQRALAEGETRYAIDRGSVQWWFEGSGGDRVLHVDSDGQLNAPQRNTITNAVDLSFGSGRLMWEG